MGGSRKAHAVVVPFPAQGHINPMMHLTRILVSHGFIVTFVNTDFNHHRIVRANQSHYSTPAMDGRIRLSHIPDGLPPDHPRTNFVQLASATENAMPAFLHSLIRRLNAIEEHPVTCVIADVFASWALDVASHLQIQRAAFWPALVATYALVFNMPALLCAGTIPPNGIPEERKMVEYLPSMPPLSSGNLPWLTGTQADREFRFKFWFRSMDRVRPLQWVLCNSFYDLEAPIITQSLHAANICPVGPLISSHFLDGDHSPIISESKMNPSLWAEEDECLDWLDRQPAESVIYASFGSITVLNAVQLEELALGLEATGRPFLWVVRSDLMNGTTAVFPWGFEERIKGRGCLVSWAPQPSVLSHPSIACFLTHCGWNSTVESIATGVPMICWPYFADQFLNCAYVVDVWKIGLALNANGDGIIEKGEIEEAVDRILAKEEGVEIKRRVMRLKESAVDSVKKEGSSCTNFNSFCSAMKKSM